MRLSVDGKDWIIGEDHKGRRIVNPAIPEYDRLLLPSDHPDKLWPRMPGGMRGGPREGMRPNVKRFKGR